MFGRSFRISLLVVQALWLNVIVPGHRRGMIALPGECVQDRCQQVAEMDGCCDMPDPSGAPHQSDKRDPAQHCLICYFAARVTPPPVIDLTPPPLRLLEQLPPPPPTRISSFRPLPTYDGRAPPQSA